MAIFSFRVICVVLLVSFLASPVPAAEKEKMKLTINWFAHAPHVGFVLAKKLGYYDAVGIDLTIEEGKGSGTTAQMVATGQTDIGYSTAGSAMNLAVKGAPIKVIAPIVQGNLYSIASLPETGIKVPKDLEGKSLAMCPGCAQIPMVEAMFAKNGVDKSKVKLINADGSAFMGLLAEKKVDAVASDPGTVSIPMKQRGIKVNDLFFQDFGVQIVGISLMAREDKLAAKPDLYRRFLAASLKGWDLARKDPKAAVAALQELYPESNPDSSNPALQLQTNVYPFLCLKGSPSLGNAPASAWQSTYEVMTQYMNFPTSKPITAYYTTDYMPANPPKCN